MAESTRKSYASGKARYSNFCRGIGVSAVPTSEPLLCRFVAQLANENVSHATIKSYLSAVRHLHIARGVGDPGISRMPRLEQVTRGIKATQVKTPPQRGGDGRRVRLPITITLLGKLRQSWPQERDKWDNIMLWAVCSLCFFGFFRSGELTIPAQGAFDQGAHLCFSDVTVDSAENPQVLKVRLKASKTDPFREGIDVFVGKTDNDLCPVAAVLRFMTLRGPGPGPLFAFRDGRPLTQPRLVTEVKTALKKAGVDCSNFSGHSFRSGAATTAASQGIEDATIKMLGRWRSNAYQLYIKTPRSQLAGISKSLCAERVNN